MSVEGDSLELNLNIPTPKTFVYAQSVEAHLEDAQRSRTLRPDQTDVFRDTGMFFRNGFTRGYVEFPTGVGKTVIFVELSKALLFETAFDQPKPKILVVEPTRDLVYQTMGRTGERGYGKFAQELRVLSYFSDTTSDELKAFKEGDFDVVVTTYRSFNILSHSAVYRDMTDEDRQNLLKSEYFKNLAKRLGQDYARKAVEETKRIPSGETGLDRFDIFIVDEAHHLFGDAAKSVFESIPNSKVVIGFTATPDANDKKKLESLLPHKIHTMELNEAIALGLSASVVPIGIKSDMAIRGGNIYNSEGELMDSRLGYLAEDSGRNRLVLDAAKILAGEGIGTIISSIAGNDSWHPQFLAAQLRREGVRAEAIHDGISPSRRQKIYKQYEGGDIDVLPFIGILGEGWDSQRTKGLVNARPSRSLIFTKQRLGRTTRIPGIAFEIDIVDDFDPNNPIITVADLMHEGGVPFGKVFGEIIEENRVSQILALFKNRLPVMNILPSEYGKSLEDLEGLEIVYRGKVYGKDGLKKSTEYALASSITSNMSGFTDEFLAKVQEVTGIKVDQKRARQGNATRIVYNVKQVHDLILQLPQADPDRYYVDPQGKRWISASGLRQLFSKRFPDLTINDISFMLDSIGSQLEWIPTVQLNKTQSNWKSKRYKALKMFGTSDDVISTINEILKKHFDNEIRPII